MVANFYKNITKKEEYILNKSALHSFCSQEEKERKMEKDFLLFFNRDSFEGNVS